MSTRGAEARIAELGLAIPALAEIYPSNPSGARFVTHHVTGETLYLTGVCANKDGKPYMTGVLGKDLSVEQGYQAARQAAVCYLGLIRQVLGSLDRVEQLLGLVGYVSCAPSFTEQAQVINGATDLFVEVFGDRGLSTRAAVGCQGLAENHSVELMLTLRFDGGEVQQSSLP